MKLLKCLGLMSGTSIDGSISAAIIETDGQDTVRRIANLDYDYEKVLGDQNRVVHHCTKAAEIAFRLAKGNYNEAIQLYKSSLEQYCVETFNLDQVTAKSKANQLAQEFTNLPEQQLDFSLAAIIQYSTILHARAVEQIFHVNNLKAVDIDYLGYHGQTLYHAPFAGITIQVGNAQYLANRTGLKVVYDFRSNDVRHRGQGAPLAPVYHQALCKQAGIKQACILNLGGTANLTVVSSNLNNILAFDTGPANALIDRWVKERANCGCDLDSQFANQGQVNQAALQTMLSQAIVLSDGRNYLDIIPPKSLDIRDYHYNFPEILNLSLEDGCATLNAFTASCISKGLRWVKQIPSQWIVSGGGVFNNNLSAQLKNIIYNDYGIRINLLRAEEQGWISTALEAELFAYLAARVANKLPITFPQVTGVKEPLEGGVIFQPNN